MATSNERSFRPKNVNDSAVAHSLVTKGTLKTSNDQSTRSEIFEDTSVTVTEEPKVEEVESVDSDDDNINVRAAIVHMIGDMIQSLGVIIAAVIIYIKPDWTIADPICTFLFSILVMFTTVPIFKDCMAILMEEAPEDIDSVELYKAL